MAARPTNLNQSEEFYWNGTSSGQLKKDAYSLIESIGYQNIEGFEYEKE